MKFINKKNFCSPKTPLRWQKGKSYGRKRYLQFIYPTKGFFLEYIENPYKSARKIKTILSKDKQKNLYKNLQEYVQMTNKHMKSCSTLLGDGDENQNHSDIPLHMYSAEWHTKQTTNPDNTG